MIWRKKIGCQRAPLSFGSREGAGGVEPSWQCRKVVLIDLMCPRSVCAPTKLALSSSSLASSWSPIYSQRAHKSTSNLRLLPSFLPSNFALTFKFYTGRKHVPCGQNHLYFVDLPSVFEINVFPTKKFHAFLFKMGRFCNTGPVFLHGHNPLALRRFGTLPTEAFGFQFDTVPTTPYFLDLTLCPHFSYQLDLYRH